MKAREVPPMYRALKDLELYFPLFYDASFKGDFQSISLIYPLTPDLAKWRAEIPHPALSKDIITIEQIAFDEIGDLEIEPLEDDDEDLEANEQ